MPRKPSTPIATAQSSEWLPRATVAALIEAETGLPIAERSLEKWPLARKVVFNAALIHAPSALAYARKAIEEAPVTVQGELPKKTRRSQT